MISWPERRSDCVKLVIQCLIALCAMLPAARLDAQPFADVSGPSGFTPSFLANIPAGGIAVADYDHDGWSDILVTGYLNPTRLYFNRGDGTFEELAEVNAMFAGTACSVAAAADYDNDGWTDVYIGCRGQSNLLMRNLGGRRFVNAMVPELDHAPAGFNPPHTDALAWGDLDGNGLLDIYIGVYPDSASPDVSNPDNLDRVVLQTAPGQWTNITAEFSVEERQKLRRPVLAAVISDLDRDGRPDLYVVNDKLKGNTLWRNAGPGCRVLCLVDMAAASGADVPAFGMGIAVGDVDRDGDWDLFYSSVDEQMFLRGQGTAPLSFQREAGSALNHFAVGWGTVFADFDNDGWEDAFLAIASGGFSNTPNQDQLFRNTGGDFLRITPDSGALAQIRPTESAARLDYDQDGDLDLVLGHWNEGYRLYRNDQMSGNHWMAFELRGAVDRNRDALGALLTLTTADGARQIRELRSGESRGASHEPQLHFGLGAFTSATVELRWPDGSVAALGSLDADRKHTIFHPSAVLFAHGFEN